MKKILLIVAVLVVSLVALGVAGYAYARPKVSAVVDWAQAPGDDWGPRGGMHGYMHGDWSGDMHGDWSGDMHGGWSGGMFADGEYGPLHEYMFGAMAEALGISTEDLEEVHDSGKTMWEVAEELGLSEEEFGELMLAARTKALDQAVADGVISQEQADWMFERMEQMWQNDGGFGGPCHGGGFGGRGGGRGGRWNSTPTDPNPET